MKNETQKKPKFVPQTALCANVQCGKVFTMTRRWHKYCSQRCGMMAFWLRHPEKAYIVKSPLKENVEKKGLV